MKNLKTNTQASARNLLTSCLCALSSAVLASSFALFAPAPEAAVAATLIDSDNDGMIDGVNDLAVDGVLFDVEFVYGSAAEVGGFKFYTEASAANAANSLMASILSVGAFFVEDDQQDQQHFMLHFNYFNDDGYGIGQKSITFFEEYVGTDPEYSGSPWLWYGEEKVYARFELVPDAPPTQPASTPEPSLILGFITLGGLMLGSKRKTKG